MKKKLALLVAIALAIGLVGCNTDELTAYERYTAANQKLSEAGSMAADLSMDIDMTVAGQTIGATMEGSVETVANSETDIDLALLMTLNSNGLSADITAYYTDGWYYMDTMGTRQKTKMDVQDVSGSIDYNIDFPLDAVKDVQFDERDGAYHITFTLDGAALSDTLSRQLADIPGIGDADVEFADVVMNAIIDKENNLKSVDMVYGFSMGVSGQNTSCEAHVHMDITQIGDVSIAFPDDLDSYPEASSTVAPAIA